MRLAFANKVKLKMQAGKNEATSAPASDRIIERPRLTRVLDAAQARIIMLIAPAGYGKSTLAEQWLSLRKHGWLRAASSPDVAALAVGIAEAAEGIKPGVLRRVTAALRRLQDPTLDLGALSRTIADELADWPEAAWLAIDDYHHAASPASDALFDYLLTHTRLNLVVTSRERPEWATARRLLYGDIYEVGQARLAMTEAEAARVWGGKH